MTDTNTKTALKKALARLLLAFVLVSIGYAVGKEVTLRRLAGRRDGPAGAAAPQAALPADGVVLYYMHPSIRCVTCVRLERTARDLVERAFADALALGRLVWREVNFEEDETLARRYNVSTSSLVVVRRAGGREVAHRTLEEVWPLADDPDAVRAVIRDAVRRALEASDARKGKTEP